MRVLAILQARMTSSRLPGKVLVPISGRPMLIRQIERVQRAGLIDEIVVATSYDKSDDVIVRACSAIGVSVCRGSLEDVLDRYMSVLQEHNADVVVRITGDCPVIDPEVIDLVVESYLESDCDYASNTLKPTFPDGFDVEVFSPFALKKAWESATLESHREHVTLYLKDNPNQFRLKNVAGQEDYSHIRLTVDEPEDLELILKIYDELLDRNEEFGFQDMLELFQRNETLLLINSKYHRDEGLDKSRLRDLKKMNHKIEVSLGTQEKASRLIPGISQLLSKRPSQFSEGVWPGYYSKAKGADIWDLDGNRYIDMSIGGIGATVLGYADDDVDDAVKSSISKGVACSLNCIEEVELADKLCQLHPWSAGVRFARTGGEAMAISVRIARACSGRDTLLFCGYHGWHDWYLASNLGANDALDGHLLPGLEPRGVPRVLRNTIHAFEYNNLDSLLSLLHKYGGEVAAIVMEPVRNIQPTSDFLAEVRKLADEFNVLLVFDEISSGFRMAIGGAHLAYDVYPDLCVFSKAIGNGYAMAAVLGTEEVMADVDDLFISSTCWTERIGPCAALATIHKFETEPVIEHLNYCGERVQDIWLTAGKKNGLKVNVYGLPPISGFMFELDQPLVLKALFIQFMLQQGILATNAFYAMYSHTAEHIEKYAAAVNISFGLIRQSIDNDGVREALRGKASIAGFRRLT